jgi:hypothetical protein
MHWADRRFPIHSRMREWPESARLRHRAAVAGTRAVAPQADFRDHPTHGEVGWRAAIPGFPVGLTGFVLHSGSSRAFWALPSVAFRRARTPEKI